MRQSFAAVATVALLAGAAGASAKTIPSLSPTGPASFNLCSEDPVGGCVIALPVGGTSITVASDGEAPFDPFGYGKDTSDGIQLDSIWVGLQTNGWNQIAGTNTWVLPACDANGKCENANISEPVGVWDAPGATWNRSAWFYIYEADGTISDSIHVGNFGAGGSAAISFNSAVPEPAAWAMMLAGFGLAGAAVRRRSKIAAAV